MINGKYRVEKIYNHHNITIDLCDLRQFHSGGSRPYEVMAMYANGADFDSARFSDLDEAIAAFDAMCEKYTDKTRPIFKKPAPLTGKYAKLRDDLKEALTAGKDAETGEDGGTCNVDAPAILMPKWTRNLVERAANEAGTGCFEWHLFKSRYFVFRPYTNAQGNDRTRNAETATKYLESLGYKTICYSCMD